MNIKNIKYFFVLTSILSRFTFVVAEKQDSMVPTVWKQPSYIGLRAPGRTQCGVVQLKIKENLPFPASEIEVVSFKYDSDAPYKFAKKGSCLLSDFPTEGIKFDRPGRSNSIFYQLRFVPKNSQEGQVRQFLPVNDIIDDFIVTPPALCPFVKVPYGPLNLLTRVTTTEAAVGTAVIAATTAAVIGGTALHRHNKQKKAEAAAALLERQGGARRIADARQDLEDKINKSQLNDATKAAYQRELQAAGAEWSKENLESITKLTHSFLNQQEEAKRTQEALKKARGADFTKVNDLAAALTGRESKAFFNQLNAIADKAATNPVEEQQKIQDINAVVTQFAVKNEENKNRKKTAVATQKPQKSSEIDPGFQRIANNITSGIVFSSQDEKNGVRKELYKVWSNNALPQLERRRRIGEIRVRLERAQKQQLKQTVSPIATTATTSTTVPKQLPQAANVVGPQQQINLKISDIGRAKKLVGNIYNNVENPEQFVADFPVDAAKLVAIDQEVQRKFPRLSETNRIELVRKIDATIGEKAQGTIEARYKQIEKAENEYGIKDPQQAEELGIALDKIYSNQQKTKKAQDTEARVVINQAKKDYEAFSEGFELLKGQKLRQY